VNNEQEANIFVVASVTVVHILTFFVSVTAVVL